MNRRSFLARLARGAALAAASIYAPRALSKPEVVESKLRLTGTKTCEPGFVWAPYVPRYSSPSHHVSEQAAEQALAEGALTFDTDRWLVHCADGVIPFPEWHPRYMAQFR